MFNRQLGRSGIEVSALSFGCWAFGGGGWGNQNEKGAIAAVHEALEYGYNFFDTAEEYGAGRSEEMLGKALVGRRDRAIISTKLSPQYQGMAREHLEASLRRLRTDYVDVYHIHWPNHRRPVAQVLKAFQQFKNEGKIRAIGVSNFGPIDLGEALATGVQIDVNQMHYNLLSRAIEYEILPMCQANQISVTAYMPLMQGLLTGKYATVDDVPPFRARTRHFSGDRPLSKHGGPGYERELFETLDSIQAVAEYIDQPMACVALARVMMQPGVASVIVGARTPTQVARNARAVSVGLSPETLDWLDTSTSSLKRLLGSNPDYWRERIR